LITTSQRLASDVQREIHTRLETLSTAETARASLEANGLIIVAGGIEEAAALADKKAPEHLELAVSHNEAREWLIQNLRNYGSLFIGHLAAEVLGDYSAGLNHTLPTSGAARFTGGLSVRQFLKTVTTLRVGSDGGMRNVEDGAARALNAAATLGRAEGLEGHAAAADIRLHDDKFQATIKRRSRGNSD
jgi:histidinol dehydrogenase